MLRCPSIKSKPAESRRKVRAEKSSNRRKSRTFFLSNFFPPKFFWFIWKQRCYNNGRPLILKLVPNDEEWNDKETRFNWIWQRKLVLKWNVTILKIIINVPNIQEWTVSGPIMCYYNLLMVKLIDNFMIWLK